MSEALFGIIYYLAIAHFGRNMLQANSSSHSISHTFSVVVDDVLYSFLTVKKYLQRKFWVL